MNKILNKIANLINVKSIVTIFLVTVFSVLSIKGNITAEQFVSIFTVVIAFYFGTQHEKNIKIATGEDE
jgi:glycerol-3-phosphate acyltransferase PlsY